MDFNVKISEVVFVGNSADTRHTSIQNGQPAIFLSCLGVSMGDMRFCHKSLRLLNYSLW